MRPRLTRREFIRWASLPAGAVVLTSCGLLPELPAERATRLLPSSDLADPIPQSLIASPVPNNSVANDASAFDTRVVAVTTNCWMSRLEVRMFGRFIIWRDGEPVMGPRRVPSRARELAAILILHPNGLPTDAIREMMFPHMPIEMAGHAIQLAAYSLRKDFGSKRTVVYAAQTYRLNPRLDLIADVREFDHALSEARSAAGDERLRYLARALDLYRGPLLAELHYDWLQPIRLEYESRYISAAQQFADLLSANAPHRTESLDRHFWPAVRRALQRVPWALPSPA
jgi:hypothetical protein